MRRRYYVLALVALLLIPVATFAGAQLSFAINPEIAAGSPDYVRTFRLLTLAKNVLLWGSFLLDCGLWLLCCAFVLKAKARSFWWLALAILGPFGLAAIAILGDRREGPSGQSGRSAGWKALLPRAAFEIAFFVLAWVVAYQAMAMWRDFMIMRESLMTGVPVAAIIDQRDASGGMWAFGEGMEVMFIVALLYALRPRSAPAWPGPSAGCSGHPGRPERANTRPRWKLASLTRWPFPEKLAPGCPAQGRA